jgi:phosphoribosyl 1,2-cyclic phosphodiesterase
MTPASEAEALVTFWGTRGSIATPGRITEKYGGNTPCVTVAYQDTHLILDAGTGIRNLGIELAEKAHETGKALSVHLFLSHTHWDHIQGLPFFQPAYLKDTTLTIYGSPRKGHFLASVLKGFMDLEYFPVGMSSFSADIRIQEIAKAPLQVGAFRVDWQEQVYHPGGSVRYRLRANGTTIIYATDVELNHIFHSARSSQEHKALAQGYLDFISHADLLIADGQYTAHEYERKAGWGHSSIELIVDVAYQAKVKQLAIFHHDPQHSDTFLDELWMRNRSKYHSVYKNMDIFWAREGLTLAV